MPPNATFRGSRREGSGNKAEGNESASSILSQIAETILDGSVPFEDALKKASEMLDKADLNALSTDLETALEQAMFDAAAKASKRGQKLKQVQKYE